MGEKVLEGDKEKRNRKGSVWEKQWKAFYEERGVSVE